MGLAAGKVDVLAAGCDFFRWWRWLGSRSLRHGIGQVLSQLLGPGAVDIADQCDHRVAGAVVGLLEALQIVPTDGLEAVFAAIRRDAVGVARIQRAPERLAGLGARALAGVAQAGQQLLADAFQRGCGETGFGQDLRKQGQRRIQLVGGGQGAQADQAHITVRAVAELRTEALEAGSNITGIQAAGALVEHGVGEHGQPGQLTVAAGASGVEQLDVEHRQLAGVHEVHRRALTGLPVLQVQPAAGGRGVQIEFFQRTQRRQWRAEDLGGGIGRTVVRCLGNGGRIRCRLAVRRTLHQQKQHATKGCEGDQPAQHGEGFALAHGCCSSRAFGRL